MLRAGFAFGLNADWQRLKEGALIGKVRRLPNSNRQTGVPVSIVYADRDWIVSSLGKIASARTNMPRIAFERKSHAKEKCERTKIFAADHYPGCKRLLTEAIGIGTK